MIGWLKFFIENRSIFLNLIYFPAIWGAVLLAYRRNAKLPADSPRKREYHPLAVFLAPFTLPFIAVVGLSLQILFILVQSVLFGVFLLLFPLVLIFFRNLGLIKKMLKLYERFGRALLKINTALLRLAGFPLPRPA